MLKADAETSRDALRRALAARANPRVSGSPVYRRWLDCELGGYGVLADIQPLHVLLGATPEDPIVRRVASYRTQIGTVFELPGARTIVHFFVESIGELESLAHHARGGSSTLLTIDFGPHAAVTDYPRSADFPADVFDRIVSGFLRAIDEVEGRRRPSSTSSSWM